MRLDFLKTVYNVAALKSIASAAAKENIAQATVSHRIDVVEDELNTKLFQRRGRGITLTASGSLLLSEGPKFFKTCQSFAKRLGSPEPQDLQLRIGVIESVLHGSFLMPWIEKQRAEHGKLKFELTVDTTSNLIDAIEHGALDVIVAALAAGDNLRKRPLPSLAMAWIGRSGVHKKSAYTRQELAEHDLLTFQVSSLPHASLVDQLSSHVETETARVHAISSISAMRSLVSSGFGIATLPRASLDPATAAAGLFELSCELPLEPLPLCLSWLEDPARPHIRSIVDSLDAAARADARRSTVPRTKPRETQDAKPISKARSRSGARRTTQREARAPASARRKLARTHERSRRKPRAR